MSTKQKVALITGALSVIGAVMVYLLVPPVTRVTTGNYVTSADNVIFSLLKNGGLDDDSVKAEIIQFANGRLSVTAQDVTAVGWNDVTIQVSTKCGELCYRFSFKNKENQVSFSGVLDLAHMLVTGTYVRVTSAGNEIVANVNMQVLKVY